VTTTGKEKEVSMSGLGATLTTVALQVAAILCLARKDFQGEGVLVRLVRLGVRWATPVLTVAVLLVIAVMKWDIEGFLFLAVIGSASWLIVAANQMREREKRCEFESGYRSGYEDAKAGEGPQYP
jgi:hypothetical protein